MDLNQSENTRPASDIISGFAMPSTPVRQGSVRGTPSRSTSLRKSILQTPRRSITIPGPQHPDHDPIKDELVIQVGILQAQLNDSKHARELETLQFEKQLRELRSKADADFRRAQAAESQNNHSARKLETVSNELTETQEKAMEDKASLERKVSNLEAENHTLKSDLLEVTAEKGELERKFPFQIRELEAMRASLQKTVEALQNDLEEARAIQMTTRATLNERDAKILDLEAENERQRMTTSDAEELAFYRTQMNEQIKRVAELESKDRQRDAELQRLRERRANIDLLEEQKSMLENQIARMEHFAAENHTLQRQKQVLEDERQSWASLLEENDQSAEFESPETIVKALVAERIAKGAFIDRIGVAEKQCVEKDAAISLLENEKAELVQRLKTSSATEASSTNAPAVSDTSTDAPAASDTRSRARLERQRTLAVKEVEFLRAQLKTYDEEEVIMNPEHSKFDEKKAAQIVQLQQLVDEYRIELDKLHEELSKREASPPEEPRGTKRPLEPENGQAESERLSVLSRKNRTLQEALFKSEQATTLAKKELEAAKSQLKSLKAKSHTRILELRENPTTDAEKIKMTTLRTLQTENQELLAQLRGEHVGVKVVPVSTLESLKLEIQEMERTIAEKEKRNRRLREIYSAKATEFREAVASLLGYKLDILPNGRVRVTSMFHLSPAYRHGDPNASSDSRGPGSMGDGEENSILFDGENGSMKLSGGNNSLFAMEIKPLLKFWVQERKDIPCFLAAMTLDFYDKTTRATRV
ncbi:Spindle-related protein [Penicillium malachiteum]|uniref:Spindle-related protein n=1 Tax=Penicillium malachiteum TaxID=1324776 RepID=UPI0025466E1E|nr:Spindle-related protein [Penicillium malachiteum]KAJ5728840.1 Spindle-related protein [Penicillium malachiteum]